jgi:hypothetical protein
LESGEKREKHEKIKARGVKRKRGIKIETNCTAELQWASTQLINTRIIQGDQKVSVHLMITVKKKLSVFERSPTQLMI